MTYHRNSLSLLSKYWDVRLGNVFLNTLLVRPISKITTRTHLGTLAAGIDGALFSRVRKSDCGSGRGFGFVIEYKNFATGTGNLKRKRKSQSLGIEQE